MTPAKVVTFDVYGTLVQWDQAVEEGLRAILDGYGSSGTDVQLAANAFEAESRRLQTVGAFRSYREILRSSLRPALATAGVADTPQDGETMLAHLSRISAYADAPPALAALSRKYRIVPISNTDDALLAGTLEALGPVFQTTVTAEQAKAYKPNPGLFRFALGKLQISTQDLVHVAQGTFSDLAVCTALGIRVIWVNRNGLTLQEGLEPIAVIRELSELEAVLEGL